MNNLWQNLFLIGTIITSVIALKDHRLMGRFMLTTSGLQQKQYDRLLLSGIVHADYGHLAFNMITYYFFAYLWQSMYVNYLGLPWWLFALFYPSAIVTTNLVVWMKNKTNYGYASLGASGGVSAIVFSCILLLPWERLYIFFIPMPAIVFAGLYLGYSFYQSTQQYSTDRTNHLAHLVGSLYGIIFSIIVKPDVLSIFIEQLLNF